jgi:small subunit ribosomal protein S21
MQVLVRDNNIDQALRVLKKKMQREGVFREMKRRRFYEKPSEQAAREKSEAVRRLRKLARKQAVREVLIAAPKKKPAPLRRGAAALPLPLYPQIRSKHRFGFASVRRRRGGPQAAGSVWSLRQIGAVRSESAPRIDARLCRCRRGPPGGSGNF